MKIAHIHLYEVKVPAHAGTIESKGINKPLHKLPDGAKAGWSLQFDEIPKLLVKLELSNGIIGWGELYRGHNWKTVEDMFPNRTVDLVDFDMATNSLKMAIDQYGVEL